MSTRHPGASVLDARGAGHHQPRAGRRSTCHPRGGGHGGFGLGASREDSMRGAFPTAQRHGRFASDRGIPLITGVRGTLMA